MKWDTDHVDGAGFSVARSLIGFAFRCNHMNFAGPFYRADG